MIEVFKTDVRDAADAAMLLDRIHQSFSGYRANFDLQDRDCILRVASLEAVHSGPLVALLHQHGFHAEVLDDQIIPLNGTSLLPENISPHK